MKRAWPVLLASLLGYAAIEAAVFRSGLYARYASPDSTTGQLETKLHNEEIRPQQGKQILSIGDSRMALVPRVANKLAEGTGYQFGSISLAGTTPRVWYYMLRDIDPEANRYHSVVIGLDTYDDQENVEDYALRESDLNYLLNRLRLTDLVEFSRSYKERSFQQRAARGVLFKGSVYQRDFQQFLLDPKGRKQIAELTYRDAHHWHYDYVETDKNLAGLTVDWDKKTLLYPPQADPALEPMLRRNLLEPLPPYIGRYSSYLQYWLTRIVEHYHGSQTRLVFVRLPRAPWIRPDLQPTKPDSSVRRLRQANIVLLPEDRFNFLERPEYFRDPMHLNQSGLDLFTKEILQELVK